MMDRLKKCFTRYLLAAGLAASVLLFTSCSSSSGSNTNGGGGGGSAPVLSFNESNVTITQGIPVQVTLTLTGSSESSVIATISSNNVSVAAPQNSQCTLSKAPGATNSSCTVTINGLSNGVAAISATAPGTTSAQIQTIVQSAYLPGRLHFTPLSESVTIGSTNTTVLNLESSSGVSGLVVSLSKNNLNANPITPTTCILSSESNSCPITIMGNTQGLTVITATAINYESATNLVNVISGSIPGTLAFSESTENTVIGESIPIVVSLNGSSGVSPFTVTFAATDTNIANITPTTCILSTTTNSCTIYTTGVATGSTTIIATANGYTVAPTTINVSSTPILGNLVFVPNPLAVAASIGASSQATIQLQNSVGVHNLAVNILAGTNLTVSPGFCCLSSNANSCTFSVNSATNTPNSSSVNGTPYPNPSCGTPNVAYESYTPVALPVNIVTPQGQPRIFTVLNKCAESVWVGISGGGFAGTADNCPSGTTFESTTSECYWNNPTPSTGSYALSTGQTSVFTIPANSYQSSTDVMWSGGLTARLNCNSVTGICDIGTCTTPGVPSLACRIGQSFAVPSTNVEFTLLQNGVDTYDVQVITGLSVPTSMAPSVTFTSDTDPYNCGTPGSPQQQSTSVRTLFASPWTFSPSVVNNIPTAAYNLVSGSVTTNTLCQTGTCTTGVCGYTRDATSQGLSPLNYQLSCGTLLSHISGDGVWKLNPDTSVSESNIAPFNFYAVVESSGGADANTNLYPTWRFYECNNPGVAGGGFPGSPYQSSTGSNANSCGCTNWAGIASPNAPCQFTNAAWTNQVEPTITWFKQACPTCYSYPYDDPASTFQCHSNASPTNPANAVNYTITFCPNN